MANEASDEKGAAFEDERDPDSLLCVEPTDNFAPAVAKPMR